MFRQRYKEHGIYNHKLRRQKQQAETAGMEILRDCLYIIKGRKDDQVRVIIGDLGQGLFLPDDPNKGKKESRYTL